MIGQNFIWKPSSKFISESNLTKYIKFINQNYAFESSGSYNELWQWSIDNPKIFWDSISLWTSPSLICASTELIGYPCMHKYPNRVKNRRNFWIF